MRASKHLWISNENVEMSLRSADDFPDMSMTHLAIITTCVAFNLALQRLVVSFEVGLADELEL